MASPLHIALLDYRDIRHPLAGGAEIYINEIFQRVADHGHKVTLLCGAYPGGASEDRIGNFRVLRAGNVATSNFVNAYKALRLARRERVDLFVENLCKLPFLLPALTRIPVLPVVLHLFGHTIFQAENVLSASYVWLYEKLIPPVYRGLNFVALSESTAADLNRRGVRANRMDVVHCGVDLKRYESGPALPRSDAPLLLYVGRLRRYKGLDIVIRAFAEVKRSVPEGQLTIVGKGEDRPRLERLVRSLGLEGAVSFGGFVSEEEKIRCLRRAHALVYPSPKEGWGLSTMEAAACGTPVLASDSDGLREAVKNGSNGFLIPHRDTGAWARRMTQVLTDAALRDRLGASGREWARQFDWDKEAEKMTAAVEAVTTGRCGE